jgi:hypothetical protein
MISSAAAGKGNQTNPNSENLPKEQHSQKKVKDSPLWNDY